MTLGIFFQGVFARISDASRTRCLKAAVSRRGMLFTFQFRQILLIGKKVIELIHPDR